MSQKQKKFEIWNLIFNCQTLIDLTEWHVLQLRWNISSAKLQINVSISVSRWKRLNELKIVPSLPLLSCESSVTVEKKKKRIIYSFHRKYISLRSPGNLALHSVHWGIKLSPLVKIITPLSCQTPPLNL